MASGSGLVNTFWSDFIPVLFNPFGVYLGRIFSRGYVPDEVLEAARVDGAGELATCFRVALRMLGADLVTVFLFQLTAIWNNFFLPVVMLSVQHHLRGLEREDDRDGAAAAGGQLTRAGVREVAVLGCQRLDAGPHPRSHPGAAVHHA